MKKRKGAKKPPEIKRTESLETKYATGIRFRSLGKSPTGAYRFRLVHELACSLLDLLNYGTGGTFCQDCQRWVTPPFGNQCPRCKTNLRTFRPPETMGEALSQPLGTCSECETAGLTGNQCWEKHFGKRPKP